MQVYSDSKRAFVLSNSLATFDPDKEYVIKTITATGTVNLFNCDQVSSTADKITATRLLVTSNSASLISAGISNTGSGSTWIGCNITSGSVTFTDAAAGSATSGFKIEIYEKDLY